MGTILIKQNSNPTNIDRVMGFDKEEDMRFPGTKVGFIPFMFQNGNYRHGLDDTKDVEHRKFVETQLLNGDSLDSEVGRNYLSKFLIEFDSEVSFIDTDNAQSLLKYYISKADKSQIAGSRKEAKEQTMYPRMFVIQELGEDAKEKLTIKQKANKARAKLSELEQSPDYLIALAQFASPSSLGIKDIDAAYLYLDGLLSGQYTDDSELIGVNRFFDCLKVEKEIIFTSSIVKEAIYKNVIRKEKGIFVNPATGTALGRSEDEVVQYLSRDENQEELGMGSSADKHFSIRVQLKNKLNYKRN